MESATIQSRTSLSALADMSCRVLMAMVLMVVPFVMRKDGHIPENAVEYGLYPNPNPDL